MVIQSPQRAVSYCLAGAVLGLGRGTGGSFGSDSSFFPGCACHTTTSLGDGLELAVGPSQATCKFFFCFLFLPWSFLWPCAVWSSLPFPGTGGPWSALMARQKQPNVCPHFCLQVKMRQCTLERQQP